MNQLCKVCGEPAAGYHFGAFTCEGCKSFFGRTYNNLSALGECKNNGQCVINKKNRTSCKSCRLKKCIVVGMSKSGSRYGRRSNWFKIHCLIQDQVEMSSRLGEQNAAAAANQPLLGLSNGALSQLSSSGSTEASPNAKDLINQYKNGLKELQESASKASPTSSSSYTSLLEAAAKSGLKLPGNGKCASPLTTGNANGSTSSKSSSAKLNKSLSQLPLSPVSPLSPFFQNQLLARNLANAANASNVNSSASQATNAAVAAAAAAAQNKLNPLGLYSNQLYNYQAAAAAAAAQFLPLQPLLQNGASLMNAVGLGLGAGLPNPLANGLNNLTAATQLANGANNRSSTSPPLSGSAPNSSASTPNSNHGPNNSTSLLQQQQQQTALLQQQLINNALRSAAAAAAAASGNKSGGAQQADGSELYGDVPEQERPIDLSVKQTPLEAFALSQLCANYGGLLGGLAGLPAFANPIMAGAAGNLDGLFGMTDCTFSPSSSNEENFANLQQLAASGGLSVDLNNKAALLNSLQLASGLGSLSNAFARENSEAASEAEEEPLQSSINMPSGSETARSDCQGEESNGSEVGIESNKNVKSEPNSFGSSISSSTKNLLTLAQLGALSSPQLQLFANAGLLNNLNASTGKATSNASSMTAQLELLKRLSELQQGARSGIDSLSSEQDDSCTNKRKKMCTSLQSTNATAADKAKDKNNNEQLERRSEGRRKSNQDLTSREDQLNVQASESDSEHGGSSRQESVSIRGTKRSCDEDEEEEEEDNCESNEALDRLKKLRRKRRKGVNTGDSTPIDGDEADDEPEEDEESHLSVVDKQIRLKNFATSDSKSDVRPEELQLAAFAVQEAH